MRIFRMCAGRPSGSDEEYQVAGSNAPPIFFSVLPKRKRAAPGPKEKNARRRTCAFAQVGLKRGSSEYVPPNEALSYRHTANLGWLKVPLPACRRMVEISREIPDTLAFSFRWRCLGGKRGPTRASAPTGCRRESGERTSYLPPRRGGCPHPPALPGFHQLLSKAQANLEGQTFRQPPRSLCQVGIRGARPTQLSSPARAGRRLSCLSRKRFRRPSYLSKPARMRRFCAKRSFLLDRARPVFFSARPKRKWGVESRSDHCTPRAAERHNTIFI